MNTEIPQAKMKLLVGVRLFFSVRAWRLHILKRKLPLYDRLEANLAEFGVWLNIMLQVAFKVPVRATFKHSIFKEMNSSRNEIPLL